MSNTQDLQALARECGATAYTNRHYPDGTALAFGPEAFAKFCAALQSPAPQPPGFDAHDMATAAADGFRDGVASVQPKGDAREAPLPVLPEPEWEQADDFIASAKVLHHTSARAWATEYGAACFAAGVQAATAQASEPSAEHQGQPTGDQIKTMFTKEHGGPNPYFRCNVCGETEPGLLSYLADHWKKHQAAPARAAEPLTELLDAAESVCATLEHPTNSVNAMQMWRLRDALKAMYGITTTPAAKEQS